jgi:hypothetical protein
MGLKPKSQTRSARRQQKEKQNMEGGYPMLLDLNANIVDLFWLASSSRHKTYHFNCTFSCLGRCSFLKLQFNDSYSNFKCKKCFTNINHMKKWCCLRNHVLLPIPCVSLILKKRQKINTFINIKGRSKNI